MQQQQFVMNGPSKEAHLKSAQMPCNNQKVNGIATEVRLNFLSYYEVF